MSEQSRPRSYYQDGCLRRLQLDHYDALRLADPNICSLAESHEELVGGIVCAVLMDVRGMAMVGCFQGTKYVAPVARNTSSLG